MKYFVIMEGIGDYSSREITPILILKDELQAQQKVEELTKKNKEDYAVWLDKANRITLEVRDEWKNHYRNHPGEKDFYIETVEQED